MVWPAIIGAILSAASSANSAKEENKPPPPGLGREENKGPGIMPVSQQYMQPAGPSMGPPQLGQVFQQLAQPFGKSPDMAGLGGAAAEPKLTKMQTETEKAMNDPAGGLTEIKDEDPEAINKGDGFSSAMDTLSGTAIGMSMRPPTPPPPGLGRGSQMGPISPVSGGFMVRNQQPTIGQLMQMYRRR